MSPGPDAVRTLQADQGFDLLLADLVLPKGMSGIELSQVARGIEPGLKVVYTSGYSEEVFRKHGRAGDDIPLLRKPFKRAELAEMLRAMLDGTQP